MDAAAGSRLRVSSTSRSPPSFPSPVAYMEARAALSDALSGPSPHPPPLGYDDEIARGFCSANAGSGGQSFSKLGAKAGIPSILPGSWLLGLEHPPAIELRIAAS
ncbi:hypothetical protein MRX96_011710 [Rhipicephalus microplus]